jgi:hypothetical protein
MDATSAAASASSIPMWAAVGLSGFCGILLTFVLGVLYNRGERNRDGGTDSGARDGGVVHDCANCTQFKEMREENRALTRRIDAWMLSQAKGGD